MGAPRFRAFRAATSYPAIVGAVLVSLRHGLGLKQAHVAESVGLVGSMWSRIENGSSALTIEQLWRVALVLKVQPSQALARAEDAVQKALDGGVHVNEARIEAKDALAHGMTLLNAAALRSLVESEEARPEGVRRRAARARGAKR